MASINLIANRAAFAHAIVVGFCRNKKSRVKHDDQNGHGKKQCCNSISLFSFHSAHHPSIFYSFIFPRELPAIRALPGIGDYTAGAIASICFEAPAAAVDGNVLRVILRLTVCADSPADVRVRRRIGEELSAVYPAGHCGDFTQALMELGATVCLPNGAPQCGACPLRALCEAHAQGTELQFPTKPPKKPRRIEQRTVFVLQCGDRLAVCKRPSRGLLAGLWQLPDVPGKLETAEALRQAEQWGVHPTGILKTAERTHIFTHVQWDLRGVWLTCAAEAPQFTWADENALQHEIGLPTAYRQFLDLHAE